MESNPIPDHKVCFCHLAVTIAWATLCNAIVLILSITAFCYSNSDTRFFFNIMMFLSVMTLLQVTPPLYTILLISPCAGALGSATSALCSSFIIRRQLMVHFGTVIFAWATFLLAVASAVTFGFMYKNNLWIQQDRNLHIAGNSCNPNITNLECLNIITFFSISRIEY